MSGLLKQYSTYFDVLSRLADPAIVILVTLITEQIYPTAFPPALIKALIIWVSIIVILVFPLFGLYRSWRGISLWTETKATTFAWILSTVLFNLLLMVSAEPHQRQILFPFCLFSVKGFLVWLSICWMILVGYRVLVRKCLRFLRTKGFNTRTAVIFGAGVLGEKVYNTFVKNRWAGIQTIGYFDDDTALQGKDVNTIPILGNIEEGVAFVKLKKVETVFLALPFRADNRIKQIATDLNDSAATCYFVPDLFSLQLFSMNLFEIAGLPLLDMNSTNLNRPGSQIIKWAEDIVFSFIILIAISPLMIAIGILIKLTSKGPVLFKQRRYGINGEEIIVYKFRTMTVCEDGDCIRQAKINDNRITRLGVLLRKTSMDELPQFINVLQGRMSIVGPRPHAIAHNEMYRKLISGYMLRHKVKPGITGWAQVNGWRGETDTIEKMQHRVEHDLYYIRNWSIWLDIKIILMTAIIGFTGKNAY